MASSDSYFRSGRPYQDQEVLNALDRNNSLHETGNQNFSKAMIALNKSTLENSKTMRETAEQLAAQIREQTEVDREQAEIDREEQEAQHRESMFQMQEIAFGMSELDSTFRISSEMLAEQVHQSGVNIIEEVKKSNRLLHSVDNKLLNISGSLQALGETLNVLVKRIERPNEVQALELADQARVSIAIGENDEALKVTRRAMELCSTSITVNAYHLITLSLFDDIESKKEAKESFSKFVRLIDFKLREVIDAQADNVRQRELIHNEIYNTVYAVIFAISTSLRGRIVGDTQTMFTSIANDKEFSKKFFVKPLECDITLQRTLYPSEVRELIWSTILQQVIRNEQDEFLVSYIIKVTDNKILLKNELIALANQRLYESDLLQRLLNKTWQEDSATEEELSCLNVFCSFQPQNNFVMNDQNLLLLDSYVKKYNLPIDASLKEVL